MLGSPCGTHILKKYGNELNELSTVATFLDLVDNLVCMAGKTRLFQWFWITDHGGTSDRQCDAKMTRSYVEVMLTYGAGLLS